MSASISSPFSCHWKLYIVPSLLWLLLDLSFILTASCQSVFMLCWATARHLPKCECPFLKGLCLPLCVWETISDSEQWSWLKSGHAAVAYVPMPVCLSVCFCVCHHTRVVTVAKEPGGVALRSVLMPLSLHGLFPFSQLPLAPSKRCWVGVGEYGEGETSHPYSRDGHSPLGGYRHQNKCQECMNLEIKETTLNKF